MIDEMGGRDSVETGDGAGAGDAQASPAGGEAPNLGVGGEDLQYDLPLDHTQKAHRPEVQNLLDQVEARDVSTPRDGAVFYSGPGNGDLARQFADETGRMTIEDTEGGKWLSEQKLYENVYDPDANPTGLTDSEANLVWSRLSQRYAEQASGEAFAFVRGANADRVFWSTEAKTLSANSNVTKVTTLTEAT